MRIYAAQERQLLVEGTYRRCREALGELGLDISPSLDEAHEAATKFSVSPSCVIGTGSPNYAEERRVVTVLFAELAGPPCGDGHVRPEELGYLMRDAFSNVMAEVEAFGGTVTAVSGTGLVALFGAPEAHEDDPERALRACFRAVVGTNCGTTGVSLRAGVETGPAVVGAIGAGPTKYYGAVGEAVAIAATLQSVARPACALVGPAARAAAESLFCWGPSEEVLMSQSAKALRASYLERPKPRLYHAPVRKGRPSNVAPIGRRPELRAVREKLEAVTAGQGGVMVIAGEAGRGKTRLVDECRGLFLAWVAGAAGRLPLWLEGRAASYAPTTPYGLYQRLISAWLGVGPGEGRAVIRTALERADKAAFGGTPDRGRIDLLADVMDIKPVVQTVGSRCRPEAHQQAAFEAITSMVRQIVHHGPTVLVLEDIHWADPTSLHLTKPVATLTKEGPLLMVLTRRPGGDDGASSLETSLMATLGLQVRKLELSPLSWAKGGIQRLSWSPKLATT